MREPGDLANPNLFPDDTEFEEFLASIRADRRRGLIYPPNWPDVPGDEKAE